MSKKQTQFRAIYRLVTALVIWFFTGTVLAQGVQPNAAKPVTKPAVSKKQTVSMSNTSPEAAYKQAAAQNRLNAQKQLNDEAAKNSKKVAVASEKEMKSTVSKSNSASLSASKKTATQGDMRKDWEIKKTKIVQDMKARGMNQYDIDKEILAIEKKLNINNNSNNK